MRRLFSLLVLAAPLSAQQPAPVGPPAPGAVSPSAAPVAAAGPRAFAPGDWYKVTTLGSPAMSPDGKLVAFTVTTVTERENKRHSEVWAMPTAGGAPVRYTAPGYESSNPRFSPDGKYLFFSSNRPGGRGNTWALRMDQPGGEAMQVENYPVGSLPADQSFAVFTDVVDTTGGGGGGGGGRGGRGGPGGFGAPAAAGAANAMAFPPYGSITKPVDQARFDGRQIVTFPYKANGIGFVPNPREARVIRPQQIFVQKFDGSKRVQVTNTRYSHGAAAVSPDGKWIAFTADAKLRPDSVVRLLGDSLARLPYDALRDEAPRNDEDIYVIPVGGGEPRLVAALQGNESALTWSPDGKKLLFIGRAERTKNARLMLIDAAAGGAPQNLTNGWQYEPASAEFLPNGEILMSADVGARTALFTVNPKTGQMRETIGGRRVIRGFSRDAKGTKVAFVATSVASPTELYLADLDGRKDGKNDGKNERKLTAFNEKVNAEIAWSDAEKFSFQGVGGLTIEAWLMKPFGYQAGKKYPLVLYIHGGPHSRYDEGWFDEFQNLAGAGFMVLYTNPRGSSGSGADFTFSTRGRWFAEDYKDLMQATDIAAQRADVDSTRMGVTGGSYGGVMTAWVTSHTNRFKAAEADRMISNWWSWYGASDAQGLTEFEFYGKPWDNPAMYDSLSPIRYVTKVKTPTLIVQSEEDHRTPMADADQWFMALKKQGIPVEWVRYPRSNHDLSRTGEPWLLVDRLGRLRQWFGHWLKP
ncbi:MAG: S9 family peptidase [Gemmatimonadota bacterium]|nr:S9 family peptidase [Gemmatimonadota bacterium]